MKNLFEIIKIIILVIFFDLCLCTSSYIAALVIAVIKIRISFSILKL